MKKIIIGGLLMLFAISSKGYAQQYTGVTGLIHTPSAEMNEEGTARIGTHFLSEEFSPKPFNYNTGSYYLSLTPFPWVEIAYTCTLQKGSRRDADGNAEKKTGYYYQDRYFSLKLRPLKEGKYWPAIAIGTNDPYSTSKTTSKVKVPVDTGKGYNGDGKSQYFCNYYIAATKHFLLKENEIGVHVAYRKWKRDYCSKWNGLVGGVTLRPCFYKPLRVIAEYTGDDINIGADCLLWKHLLLQASLQNGKDFSGGICFQINLF
ncbi:YjbH domain-containing protein [Bacteroides sp.]|uniref:YjbH domain-containing protein n=1 Tax=Bacteroides sp. TaxID=29523 RepID=UPI003AB17DE6